jgi:hypothetical protein
VGIGCETVGDGSGLVAGEVTLMTGELTGGTIPTPCC